MKRMVKSLLFITTFLLGSSAAYGFDGFSPYVGLEGIWQYTALKNQVTDNVNIRRSALPKSYWGGNIFLGGRFCDMWGLELGYSLTTKRSRNHRVDDSKFSNRFSTVYLDLNGYLPLDNCWDLIGSIGVAAVKPKFNETESDGTPIDGLSISNKSRAAFRLGAGAQYMITECFGIRALVRWETTSSLRTRVAVAGAQTFTFKPFRDSVIGSLGVFWRF